MYPPKGAKLGCLFYMSAHALPSFCSRPDRVRLELNQSVFASSLIRPETCCSELCFCCCFPYWNEMRVVNWSFPKPPTKNPDECFNLPFRLVSLEASFIKQWRSVHSRFYIWASPLPLLLCLSHMSGFKEDPWCVTPMNSGEVLVSSGICPSIYHCSFFFFWTWLGILICSCSRLTLESFCQFPRDILPGF